MKNLLLLVIAVLSVFSAQSQSYSRYVNFSPTTRDVSFSKLTSCRDDISCEYSVDGRVVTTYRLSYFPTIVALPTVFSRCTYRFYLTASGPESRSGDIGIAVVDDIDIKYFENPDLFFSYFSTNCESDNYTYYIINNIMLPSVCVCKYYASMAPVDLLFMFNAGTLGSYLQSKCEKTGLYYKTMETSSVIALEEARELLLLDPSRKWELYDMLGKSYLIQSESDFKLLPTKVYVFSITESGTTKYYKMVK